MYQEVCFNRGTEAGGGGGVNVGHSLSPPSHFMLAMGLNRKYEELSCHQKSGNVQPYSSNSIEICDPIIVNPVRKMRPHPTAHSH